MSFGNSKRITSYCFDADMDDFRRNHRSLGVLPRVCVSFSNAYVEKSSLEIERSVCNAVHRNAHCHIAQHTALPRIYTINTRCKHSKSKTERKIVCNLKVVFARSFFLSSAFIIATFEFNNGTTIKTWNVHRFFFGLLCERVAERARALHSISFIWKLSHTIMHIVHNLNIWL